MSHSGEVLLHLSGCGNSLRVVTGDQSGADVWVHIEVMAHPFSGVIDTLFTPADLETWRDIESRLEEHGSVFIEGRRSPELEVERHDAVLSVAITPDGDDPQSILRFLILPDPE